MPEARRLSEFSEERRTRLLDKMKRTGCRLREADKAATVWGKRGSFDWFTPEPIVAAARRVMGQIELDPASSADAQKIVRASRYYTVEDDGIEQRWDSPAVWLNPPFGTITDRRSVIAQWLDKLFEEVAAGRVTQALVLTRAATESIWFQQLWNHPLCFIRGRPRFIPGPLQTDNGVRPNAAISIAAVGEVDVDRFVAEFSKFGKIVLPGGNGFPSPIP